MNVPANHDNLVLRIRETATAFGGQSATLTQLIKDASDAYGIDGLPTFLTIGYRACPAHARSKFWNSCRVILSSIEAIKVERQAGRSLQVLDRRLNEIGWKQAQARQTVNGSQFVQVEQESVNRSHFQAQPESVKITLSLPKPLIEQLGDIVAQLSDTERHMALAMLQASMPTSKTKRGKKAA